jgi:Fur family peroxide stress response transcriptional regulator
MDNSKPVTRRTRQRDLILKTLRSTDSHPTADWIYDQVKKQMPNISLGTVYRNLGILKQSGEIMELSYGSRYSRFDGNPKNHYHFVCVNCDKVIDLHQIPVDKEMEAKISEEEDVQVFFHRTEFYGLCGECRKKGKTDGLQ